MGWAISTTPLWCEIYFSIRAICKFRYAWPSRKVDSLQMSATTALGQYIKFKTGPAPNSRASVQCLPLTLCSIVAKETIGGLRVQWPWNFGVPLFNTVSAETTP